MLPLTFNSDREPAPPGYEILDAVVRDVWTPPLRQWTHMRFIAAHGQWEPRVALYRAHWDTYHFSMQSFPWLTDTRALITEVDKAIRIALDLMPNVSVSEALVAGEWRRCVRKEIYG